MTATEGQAEPRRADAQRNRQRILQVATEALLESADASLNSIAKKAGVGIGTLYRHFPTREALVLEVYRQELQNIEGAPPRLLARYDPLDALRAWMDRMAQYGMTYPVAADGHSDISKGLYHIQGVPETFVINKQGNIERFFYFLSDDTTLSTDDLQVNTTQLARMIDSLLAES